jgi:hypothetical protein
MIRKIFAVSAASAAILIAAPAVAAPGGGGHAGGGAGGPGAHAGANVNMGATMGSTHASPNSSLNRVDTNIPSTNPAVNVSQGPAHASINGITNASPNSVLARGSVSSTTLPGLTTGLNVQNSTGTTIGQVSQVVTDSSGNIRLVIVTNSSGQTFRLAPNTLTINGGTVVTTSTTGG